MQSARGHMGGPPCGASPDELPAGAWPILAAAHQVIEPAAVPKSKGDIDF